jgi:hypothetical protein
MKLFSLLETKYQALTNKFKSYITSESSTNGEAYGNHTVFGQLISVLTASVQNMMLYIEDAMIEQNKYTAQRKRSVYGLAAQTGYEPFLGKAAGVQLKISYIPNNEKNLNIIINNHCPVTCTQNGLMYNMILSQEAIFLSPEKDISSKYIYAVQGKFETQIFVSRGGNYYTQNMNFVGNLDTDYLEVYINNEKWDYVSSFYDMTAEGKQWTFKVSPNSGIDFVFGNGVHGKALKDRDVIKINYLVHDGELGNLDSSQESYFVFTDQLSDNEGNKIDGNNVLDISFASKDSVVSGSNSESIFQVRHMIGTNSRSLVLASPDHYKSFINRFSFCGYSRSWSDPGSLVINSLIMKNFKLQMAKGMDYFNLRDEDFKLTEIQKESIKNCLENTGCQLAGVTYNIVDPNICKYAMYVHVKLKQADSNKEYITSQIKSLIGDFFSDIKSDIFIPKSDIIYLLKNNIKEIDGVEVNFLSERNESAIRDGYYFEERKIYNPHTNQYEKKIEKIGVYAGENPRVGLDEYGNILLPNDAYFPILKGGWTFTVPDMYLEENKQMMRDSQEITVTDPVTIIYR